MKMLVIDGNSVLFRAYHATASNPSVPIMCTSKGQYTNAVYAFSNMLNKALQMIRPEYCVVAFDKGKHNFRHDMDASYKANRKPTPEPLKEQFALVREFLEAYNVPYIEYDEIEGDDIIGSLTQKFPLVSTCILTSDKDMLQLLDERTSVYLMRRGLSDISVVTPDNLDTIWDVSPEQVIDLKALMGDSSDNIPGVEHIGEKTAIQLLQAYGNLDGIYEHIDELKGKRKEYLIEGKDNAYLSKELATIRRDVDFDVDVEDLRVNLSLEDVNAFYRKYEMTSLIKKTLVVDSDTKRTKKVDVASFSDKPVIYLDTDELEYITKIYGLAIATGKDVNYIAYEDLVQDTGFLTLLADDSPKVVYDYKRFKHNMEKMGLEVGDNYDDVMLMGFLVNNYYDSLEALLRGYGHDCYIEAKEIYGTLKKPKVIDTQAQAKRACNFALALEDIYLNSEVELKEKEVYNLYKDVELPLAHVLYDMEKEGICCDRAVLEDLGNELSKRIETKAQAIYEHVGHTFNINSTVQLAEVLFDELELPANRKRSTNAQELEKLELYHPIIKDLMDYRKDTKLYSTYIEGLEKNIAKDGKIHTIFSQTITQTGRLSSSEPNLQNIAVRDEEGKAIRKAFMATGDNLLLSSDYSQIELRVLSALADEQSMKEAFDKDIDIHTKTAMDIFGLREEEVDDLHRRKAKAINFGIVYGISDFGLAKQAGLSVFEARDIIKSYYITYPSVRTFLDGAVRECEEKGYVTTILGRRRYIKEINSDNYNMVEFAKRAAKNSKVQGSAADLIKVAMVNIHKRMKKEGLKSKMVLQIHDELIFDVLPQEKEIMMTLVKEEMTKAIDLNVKLEVSMSSGRNWYEAK